MTTDQQIIEVIRPILDAASAIDGRINTIIVNIGNDDKPPFISFYGDFPSSERKGGEYGVEANLATVKPFNPAAEKRAAIEKLRAELAALETADK